jgi:hypothetical protein
MNRLCIWLGWIGMMILFIGLGIADMVPPPPPDAPVTLYTDNRHAIQVGLVIAMFGGALYGPWLVMLARAFKLAERESSAFAYFQLAFGVIFVVLVEVPLYMLQVAVYRPGASPNVVQGFVDASWVMTSGFVYTFVVAVLLSGIFMVREQRALGLFPRWLGWLNIVVALACLPGLFAGTVTSGALAWDGIVASGVPSVAFFPWFVAWTWFLLRLERQPSGHLMATQPGCD